MEEVASSAGGGDSGLSNVEGSVSTGRNDAIDEYDDDDDPGYVILKIAEDEFTRLYTEAISHTQRARNNMSPGAEMKLKKETTVRGADAHLTTWINDMPSTQSDKGSRPPKSRTGKQTTEQRAADLMKNANLRAFNLKIIHEPMRTGFEIEKDFLPERSDIVAGRYQVEEFLGEAAFSTAIQCRDLASESQNDSVCLKIIKNIKDYFDQSLDEIKLLHYINSRCEDPDRYHVLKMIDHFYCKEHLILVTELLKDNLYEYNRYIRYSKKEPYFTIPRIRSIMQQLLEAVAYVHSLKLIHCDIKPENILMKSYSQVKVKLIDFGSSCFTTDFLNTYVQSRSYRAPEVILGLPYSHKIDIWSLGCVAAELYTGKVLFANSSVPSMLARMVSILGPMPTDMVLLGTMVDKYFLSNKMLYERKQGTPGIVNIMRPKKTTLKNRLHSDDDEFVDMVRSLVQYDTTNRPTALQALKHPFFQLPDEYVNAFEAEVLSEGTPSSKKASLLRRGVPKRMLSSKGKAVDKPVERRKNNENIRRRSSKPAKKPSKKAAAKTPVKS